MGMGDAVLLVVFIAVLAIVVCSPWVLIRNLVRLRRLRRARASAVAPDPALGSARTYRLQNALAAVGLLLVVVLVGLPMCTSIASRSRIAKAQAELRMLYSAAMMYREHMGAPPATLDALTATARNAHGEVAGPFMAQIPSAPSGFTPYSYRVAPDGRAFTLTSEGDGYTVIVP